MQRRTRTMVAALVGALALVGAACAPSNTPTEYDSLVEANFLEGCTNQNATISDDTVALTDDTLSDEVQGGTPDACRCQYDVFVQQVPYNGDARDADQARWGGYDGPTFTELDSDLGGDNPADVYAELPESVRTAVSACASGAASTTTTTTAAGDATTTTATGGDTTASTTTAG